MSATAMEARSNSNAFGVPEPSSSHNLLTFFFAGS